MRRPSRLAIAAAACLLLSATAALATARSGSGTARETASADTLAVFGPKRFEAVRGGSAHYVERFAAPRSAAPHLVRVEAASGEEMPSGVSVKLNGAVLFSASSQGGTALEVPMALGSENALEVTVQESRGAVQVSVLAARAAEFALLHPRRFVRSSGTPAVETARFSVPASGGAPFRLHVLNGEPDGTLRATSAVVRLNGEQVVSPSDVNPQTGGFLRSVAPGGENLLEVEVRGAPGSFLTLWVTATDTLAPVLVVDAPANGLVTRDSSVEASGRVEDATASVVTVNGGETERSGDAFRARVPLAAEGANVLTFTGVDGTGLRTDSVRTVIRDAEPPVIALTAPVDGSITRDTVITVSGVVTDRTLATVNVNGIPVTPDAGGGFLVRVPLSDGANFVTVTATDRAGNATTVLRQATRDRQPPVITVTRPENGATTEAEEITVRGAVQDATPVTLNVGTSSVAVGPDGSFEVAVPLAEGENDIALKATDAAGNEATVTVTVTRDAGALALPPDPATVAPALNRTVATAVHASTEFLYTGSTPIQTGVAPGTIQPVRASVLRGRVLTREGEALAGVRVAVKDHPELGQTLSREDGAFDLAVNGGGLMTLDYVRAGYLSAQRQVRAPAQDFVAVDDVALVPLDPQVSRVTLSPSATDAQVARGSVAADADGARQPTLIFKPGTEAWMVLPDGSTQPLTTLSIRATEFTVGPNGQTAMPGPLPPSVAYTYALDLGVDEARAAGAEHVHFSQPVAFYVDNFLEFPVGTAAPVAWYDYRRSAWVPETDGVVLAVLDVSGGIAQLDTDGDGVADADSTLLFFGIDAPERQRLAAVYPAGASLWRVQMPHFSPWDINWLRRWFAGFTEGDGDPIPDGGGGFGDRPNVDAPKTGDDDKQDDPQCQDGSIIECENQVLGETIGISGTSFTLNYRSDRAPGYGAGRSIIVPLTRGVLPEDLRRVEVQIEVAGQVHRRSFVPEPDQSYPYVWDGKDAYGRVVQGRQRVRVTVSYVYPMFYRVYRRRCREGERTLATTFGTFVVPLSRCENTRTFRRVEGSGEERQHITREIDVDAPGAPESWDARALGWGGWTLNVNHVYDPAGKVLRLGDGRRQTT